MDSSLEVRRAEALQSGRITDIVFRTELSLVEIAEAIGLRNIDADGENYWEWVIGRMGWLTQVDITRTHKKPPSEVDTRLFLLGGGEITGRLKTTIVTRLGSFVPGPIRCGQSIYIGGNEFDFVTIEEHP